MKLALVDTIQDDIPIKTLYLFSNNHNFEEDDHYSIYFMDENSELDIDYSDNPEGNWYKKL